MHFFAAPDDRFTGVKQVFFKRHKRIVDTFTVELHAPLIDQAAAKSLLEGKSPASVNTSSSG